MKLKTQITIDINQFENVKPEIELDTEDLDAGLELIQKLWSKFHGCCKPENIQKIIEDVRSGKPIALSDYERSVQEGYGLDVNEAKKEFKRSPEYKAKITKRFTK